MNKRRFPKKLVIVALVSALLGGGATAGGFAIAEQVREPICEANMAQGFADRNQSPAKPDEIHEFCTKGIAQINVVQHVRD